MDDYGKRARKTAYLGLLTSLARIVSYVEFLIPIPMGIPGVKPGLANLVIVWALYTMKPGEALLVNIMRILLAGFLFGNLSMILYSVAGALTSFLAMYLVKKSGLLNVTGVSIVGGILHNMGQLALAAAVLETSSLVYYAPVLVGAGAVTGFLIGAVSQEVLRRVPV